MLSILLSLFMFLQPFPEVTEDDIKAWIYAYSEYYNTSPTIPLAVAKCESINFDYRVINNLRLGLAGEVGTFQFHPRGVYTETPQHAHGYSRYDPEANVAAGVWALSHGKARHWTCYRMLFY